MQTKPQLLVPKCSGQKAQPRMGCVGLLAWKELKRPLAHTGDPILEGFESSFWEYLAAVSGVAQSDTTEAT